MEPPASSPESLARPRVKVLQLVSLAAGSGSSRGAGGPEIRAAESLRYWDPTLLEIHIAYSSTGQLVEDFSRHPNWIDFVVTSHRRLSTFRRLEKIIAERDIELVHTQGPVYTDFVATVAAHRRGISNVVTRAVQISDFQHSLLKRRVFLLVDRYTKSKCSSMVAISAGGAQTLLQEGCRPDVLRLVYNGVDTEKFNPLAVPTVDRGKDELVIAMFAQMVPHKRHDILIRALQLATRAGRSWRLLLVGDGPRRAQLAEMAEAAHLGDRVIFLGFIRDIAGIYASADIVALASDREGFPVTLLEGMASGRTCVASGVAGVNELFDGGTAGVIVPSNTAEDFYSILAALDDNRTRIAEIGGHARQRVVKNFSLQAMVNGYTDIYLKHIRNRSGCETG